MENKKSNKFTQLMPMFPNRALRRKKKKLGEYVPPKEGEWRSKCQNNCGDDCVDWCPHYEEKISNEKISKDVKMTREEAYQAMMAGKWITHNSFSKNEYLKMPYSTILDEENNHFEKGWEMRKGGDWENGWSIKEKNN